MFTLVSHSFASLINKQLSRKAGRWRAANVFAARLVRHRSVACEFSRGRFDVWPCILVIINFIIQMSFSQRIISMLLWKPSYFIPLRARGYENKIWMSFGWERVPLGINFLLGKAMKFISQFYSTLDILFDWYVLYNFCIVINLL